MRFEWAGTVCVNMLDGNGKVSFGHENVNSLYLFGHVEGRYDHTPRIPIKKFSIYISSYKILISFATKL